MEDLLTNSMRNQPKCDGKCGSVVLVVALSAVLVAVGCGQGEQTGVVAEEASARIESSGGDQDNPLRHDFGVVLSGVQRKHVFNVVNRSEFPWRIERVAPSCACTVPVIRMSSVNPGETLEVPVTFSAPATTADIRKFVDIHISSDPSFVMRLELIAAVREPISAFPPSLSLGPVTVNSKNKITGKVLVGNFKDRLGSAPSIAKAPEWIYASLSPRVRTHAEDGLVGASEEWELNYTVNTDELMLNNRSGWVSGVIVIQHDEVERACSIPITIQATPAVVVAPKSLHIRDDQGRKDGCTKTLIVRSMTESFQCSVHDLLLDTTKLTNGIDIEIKSREAINDSTWRIELQCTRREQAEPLTSELLLCFPVESYPSVSVTIEL